MEGANKAKGLKRSKKEIINDGDYDLNSTNLYEVNTDKLLANVLQHQNANVLDPSIPNRNRSKKIRSAWLHNLPAVEGQSQIEKAPSPKIMMSFGAALQKERAAAAAQAAIRTNAMKRPNNKGGRRTRRLRRKRPSKASRKI